MSVTTSVRQTAAPTVPDELDSPNAKLVYLYLDTSETATVDDMQSALSMGKMALFSVLDSLTSAGVVEEAGAGAYTTA